MAIPARPWLANLGLQRRIQLLALISLLAIFSFFWFAGQQALEESTRHALDNQLTVASAVSSSLDYRLNAALTVLEKTAAQLDSRPTQLTERQTAELRDAQLQLSAYGQRLFWLDADGYVLWTEPFDPALLSKPFVSFSAIRPALYREPRYVSNLCQPSDLSPPYILLAVSVPQPPSQAQSLLVEQVSSDQLGLGDLLSRVKVEGGYIQVVDHEGTILASSLSWSRYHKGDHSDQFTHLIDNQQALVSECHQCHTRNDQSAVSSGGQGASRTDEILAFSPLSVAPWGVAVRQPISQVMAPIYFLRRLTLVGTAAALVAALLATWLISRQIIEPIQALDEASAQFAEGNLDVAIPAGGIDEVARLTANLEQMRVRLEATLKDHRRWNEALEEMVEERTRELALLYEQLQGREVMCKRLLGKVLTAQEEERARLARELHDSIGQSLTAIIMSINATESALPPTQLSAKDKLANVRNMASQTLHDLRGLIFDLRPEVLDDLGLGLALHSQVKKYLEPAGVRVKLQATGLKDLLPAEVETAVFRVVQEAITNIARHAQASDASITLTKKDDRLIVRVEDNGVGFDLNQVKNGGQQAWGLHGMEERITLLGGKFYVGSTPGHGTLVLAEVPLNQNNGVM
jgi:signal transduction histidine kinase